MDEIGVGVQLDEPPAGVPLQPTEAVTNPTPVIGPHWAQPAPSAGGGGGSLYDTWDNAAADQPTPRHAPRRRAAAVLAIVAMALASGGAGLAAGAALGRRSASSTTSVVLPQVPSSSAPSSGSDPLPSPSAAAPPSLGSGGAVDTAAIAAAVDPGVVDITTTLAGGRAAGTGMVLTPSGLVLTNNHVIEGSTSVNVQINGSGPLYPATVLGYDVSDDVALLQIQNVSGLKTVSVGDSSKVAVNDAVIAIGNALGRSGPPAVTQGRVAALDQTITANDTTGKAETLAGMIQISAPLQPGDSGGPLVNAAAQVIGMNTAANGGYRRFSASNVAFAIPINKALTLAHQIQAGQASATVHIGARAILGVEVQDASASSGSSRLPTTTAGAEVAGIAAGSPAQSAGLTAGDVIVSVGPKSISSVSDLQPALDRYHPGDRVSLGWIDASGQHRSATVQLAAGPPA